MKNYQQVVIPCKLVEYPYHFKGNLLFRDSAESLFLLYLCMFYHFELINRQSLLAHFKLLREGRLDRTVNTYHCRINDEWYNNTHMSLIFEEIYISAGLSRKSIPIEDLMQYVSLFLNKPYNYCLDYIYYEYVEPFLKNHEVIFDYNLVSDDMIPDYNYYEASGYCCDDCDGCYCDYKRIRYQNIVNTANMKIEREFETYFKSLRKFVPI